MSASRGSVDVGALVARAIERGRTEGWLAGDLRAAFLAADEEGQITAAHLAKAAQLEYEAMGKLSASR